MNKSITKVKLVCSKCDRSDQLDVANREGYEFFVFCGRCQIPCAYFEVMCYCKQPKDYYFVSLSQIGFKCKRCYRSQFKIVSMKGSGLKVQKRIMGGKE